MLTNTENWLENFNQMVSGDDKAFNPVRDTVFGGNEFLYDGADVVTSALTAEGVVKEGKAALESIKAAKTANISNIVRSDFTVGSSAERILGEKVFVSKMKLAKPVLKEFAKETTKESTKKGADKIIEYTFDNAESVLNRNNDPKKTIGIESTRQGLKFGAEEFIDKVVK